MKTGLSITGIQSWPFDPPKCPNECNGIFDLDIAMTYRGLKDSNGVVVEEAPQSADVTLTCRECGANWKMLGVVPRALTIQAFKDVKLVGTDHE